jgi:energy-coupling factor transport system permease protein
LSQISLIQRTRGINIREGRLAKRVKDGLTLLRVLLVWSLEEALQTADSMKARGYGTAKRSSYTVFRMDRRDRTMVVYLSVVMLLCIAGWTQGYGELAIYPHLEQAVFTWQEALMYGCYCAFLLTPVYMEGKEFFAWKSFK